MGGSINVVVRFPDGKLYKAVRWTNPLPWLLNNPDLIDGKVEPVLKWKEVWDEMKKDWDEHGPKGPFDQPMTDAYFPNPEIVAPVGYGIIVIDFQTKTIVDVQGYTGPKVYLWIPSAVPLLKAGKIKFRTKKAARVGKEILAEYDRIYPGLLADFRKRIGATREGPSNPLADLIDPRPVDEKEAEESAKDYAEQEACHLLFKKSQNLVPGKDYVVDRGDWKWLDCEESPKGHKKARKALKIIRIAEDTREWDEFVREDA